MQQYIDTSFKPKYNTNINPLTCNTLPLTGKIFQSASEIRSGPAGRNVKS
jgi:hypothetical protein